MTELVKLVLESALSNLSSSAVLSRPLTIATNFSAWGRRKARGVLRRSLLATEADRVLQLVLQEGFGWLDCLEVGSSSASPVPVAALRGASIFPLQ